MLPHVPPLHLNVQSFESGHLVFVGAVMWDMMNDACKDFYCDHILFV